MQVGQGPLQLTLAPHPSPAHLPGQQPFTVLCLQALVVRVAVVLAPAVNNSSSAGCIKRVAAWHNPSTASSISIHLHQRLIIALLARATRHASLL
jgi:hypothetical protein